MDSLGKPSWWAASLSLSKSCVCSSVDVSSLQLGPGEPPTSCNQMWNPGVGPRAAAKPNVLGNVHCIVSCNSFARTVCPAVGGSRNVRVGGRGLEDLVPD